MSFRGLNPQNTLLVIVDYQEKLLKIMEPEITGENVTNIGFFIEMFRHWQAPVLVSEQYPKGLGRTHALLMEKLDVEPIEKMVFSCCAEPVFLNALEKTGRHNVILTGIEAHICVLQTALDLLERDYHVCIAVDAVQSSSRLRWEYGLRMMERAGAILLPTESILYQMIGRAGTEDLRMMVDLIKGSRVR